MISTFSQSMNISTWINTVIECMNRGFKYRYKSTHLAFILFDVWRLRNIKKNNCIFIYLFRLRLRLRKRKRPKIKAQNWKLKRHFFNENIVIYPFCSRKKRTFIHWFRALIVRERGLIVKRNIHTSALCVFFRICSLARIYWESTLVNHDATSHKVIFGDFALSHNSNQKS